jgi:ATP-dependent exoDNAse (exonuclease V) beta subunit
MTAAWSDEARAVEGRPDAQEEAVALFTMHAAKGLEWPIVIPVNTMTGVMAPESAVIDRQTETFYCPVLGVTPEGYETARQSEKEELDRERIRLWYVAATRARELLVLPRLDATPSNRPGSVSSICRSPTFPAWTSLTCLPVSRPQERARATPRRARASPPKPKPSPPRRRG